MRKLSQEIAANNEVIGGSKSENEVDNVISHNSASEEKADLLEYKETPEKRTPNFNETRKDNISQ